MKRQSIPVCMGLALLSGIVSANGFGGYAHSLEICDRPEFQYMSMCFDPDEHESLQPLPVTPLSNVFAPPTGANEPCDMHSGEQETSSSPGPQCFAWQQMMPATHSEWSQFSAGKKLTKAFSMSGGKFGNWNVRKPTSIPFIPMQIATDPTTNDGGIPELPVGNQDLLGWPIVNKTVSFSHPYSVGTLSKRAMSLGTRAQIFTSCKEADGKCLVSDPNPWSITRSSRWAGSEFWPTGMHEKIKSVCVAPDGCTEPQPLPPRNPVPDPWEPEIYKDWPVSALSSGTVHPFHEKLSRMVVVDSDWLVPQHQPPAGRGKAWELVGEQSRDSFATAHDFAYLYMQTIRSSHVESDVGDDLTSISVELATVTPFSPDMQNVFLPMSGGFKSEIPYLMPGEDDDWGGTPGNPGITNPKSPLPGGWPGAL